MSRFSNFRKTWVKPEILPIVGVISVAVTGASWYLFHLSRGPQIQWSRENQAPWEKIDQDTQVKLVSLGKKFDKNYER